jgi:hypothetical protein
MGMGDGLGRTGRAGGEDEICQPVGIAEDHLSRRMVHHRRQIGEDGGLRILGQRHARRREDGGRRDQPRKPRDLGHRQSRGRGHGDQSGGHGAEEGHREIDGIAEP